VIRVFILYVEVKLETVSKKPNQGTAKESLATAMAQERPIGRPRMKPIILPTESLLKRVKHALQKDLCMSTRSDMVRLNLLRKAISIPKLILKNTQHANAIKELNAETAEAVYKSCYQEFVLMCCIYGILIDRTNDKIFKAFISLKYPESKVKPLLTKSDENVYNEVKTYLGKLSVKALFNIKSKVIWELFRALLKLTYHLVAEKLDEKSQSMLDTMVRKLEFKLKRDKLEVLNISNSWVNPNEELSSVCSEDRD
jgi:hypothetical protein